MVLIGLVLSVQRYTDAVGSDVGTDLRTFVDAAGHVRDGGSPYAEPGYAYSPFIAWMLVPFEGFDVAVGPWTAMSIAALWGAVALVTATFWPALSWWQRPVLACVGLVTALYSALLSLDLWLGQTDPLLPLASAAAVFFAARNRQVASGIALAFGAIIKSWPVGLGLWMFRRGVPHRGWLILATVATGLLFLAIALVVSGPGLFAQWYERTAALSEQDLVAYSVWGAGRHLFTDSGALHPLTVAPPVGSIVSWALAAVVLALIAWTLWAPGDDALAMWNIAAAVVLLLPVSHLWYLLLVLPLLWTWVAHALAAPKRIGPLLAVGVLAVWWVVSFRLPPLDNQFGASTSQYVAVVATTLIALAVSVFLASRIDAERRSATVDA